MSYLVFFAFLALFCIFLIKVPFFKNSGIKASWLIIFFLARVLTGMITCYLAYHHIVVKDSLLFHNAGLNEYYQLIHNPGYFISETFRDYGKNFSGILEVHQSFWNNLKTNVIVKTLAFLNIITLRSFYTNTLIFNFVVFTGVVALYRAFSEIFSIKWVLAMTIFLIPTALFFTSAIHRDGLMLLGWGWLIYTLQSIDLEQKDIKKWIFLSFLLLFMFILRNYVVFICVPFLLAWWLSNRLPRYAFAFFPLILIAGSLLFFLTRDILPFADFPQFIVNRQAAFLAISEGSNTYLPIPKLQPDFISFLQIMPRAITNGLLEPLIWHLSSPVFLAFAIESIVIVGLFLWWMFKGNKVVPLVSVYIAFCSFLIILMIGYTVPNLGSIVRYRSIYIQFILILLLNSFAEYYLIKEKQ